MYEYRGTVRKAADVHDGDTVRVLLDQGLREYRDMAIRLHGINAPELATPAGPPSRDHLIGLLGGTFPASVVVRTIRDAADKYGERWGGRIWLESAGMWGSNNEFITVSPSVNQTMVADGFAVVYLP